MSLREEILLDKLQSDLRIEKARLKGIKSVDMSIQVGVHAKWVIASIESVIEEIEIQILEIENENK
ncbi:MAG TPA: hypothetical protein VN026_13475 [Bacteroidia bacterium]|jgi:hypothetical protein|nr:hypothetical protein [Bacteroidia bacterium]